eukprot:7233305-Prymnesium_polylepis.2
MKAKKVFATSIRMEESALSVQNEKAFSDHDATKMKGDAELNRVCFRINAIPLPDGLSNDDFLAKMLPTIVSNEPEQTKQMIVDEVVAHTLSKLENDKQRTLYLTDRLDPKKMANAMPMSCLATLFAAIGVFDDIDRVIANVVRSLLVNSEHVRVHAAMKYLFDTFDAAPAPAPAPSLE